MIKEHREFNRSYRVSIVPPQGHEPYTEDASRELIWSALMRIAHVTDAARAQFTGPLAERNRLAAEIQAYIKQAKAYDDGASHVSGTSAALLNYYCLLNLAKAELILANPSQIIGQKVRHGVYLKLGTPNSLRGDRLVVNNGVFKLLYEKRTGSSIPLGTELPISRLLARVLEIGRELDDGGLEPCTIQPILHSVLMKDGDAWSVLGLPVYGKFVKENRPTLKVLSKGFEQVDESKYGWTKVFDVNKTFSNLDVWQSKTVMKSPSLSLADVSMATGVQLSPYLDYSSNRDFDGFLIPSLYKHRAFPMPQSVARYALMFYISSLVRYHPSRLDTRKFGERAWVLSAFTQWSAIPALGDAMDGIFRRVHQFGLHHR